MAFVSVLAFTESDQLRIVASAEPITITQPLTPDGTFGDPTQLIIFQREVPEAEPVLADLHNTLASSRAGSSEDLFDCPAPHAIRAIEVAVARRWPPHNVRCPDCQYNFVAPYAAAHRMYLACPHCHNSLLNPRWDST